jgi:hypothetical protein
VHHRWLWLEQHVAALELGEVDLVACSGCRECSSSENWFRSESGSGLRIGYTVFKLAARSERDESDVTAVAAVFRMTYASAKARFLAITALSTTQSSMRSRNGVVVDHSRELPIRLNRATKQIERQKKPAVAILPQIEQWHLQCRRRTGEPHDKGETNGDSPNTCFQR